MSIISAGWSGQKQPSFVASPSQLHSGVSSQPQGKVRRDKSAPGNGRHRPVSEPPAQRHLPLANNTRFQLPSTARRRQRSPLAAGSHFQRTGNWQQPPSHLTRVWSSTDHISQQLTSSGQQQLPVDQQAFAAKFTFPGQQQVPVQGPVVANRHPSFGLTPAGSVRVENVRAASPGNGQHFSLAPEDTQVLAEQLPMPSSPESCRRSLLTFDDHHEFPAATHQQISKASAQHRQQSPSISIQSRQIEALESLLVEHLQQAGIDDSCVASLREQLHRRRQHTCSSTLFKLFKHVADGQEAERLLGHHVHRLNGKVLRLSSYNLAPSSPNRVSSTNTPKLYLIGGRGGDFKSLADIEIYDMATQTWSMAPSRAGGADMEDNTFDLVGDVIEESVYVGSSSNGIMAVLSSSDGKWSELPPMAKSRKQVATAVARGELYVIDGFSGISEVFSPLDRKWSSLPLMATRRQDVRVAVLNDKVYVVGNQLYTAGQATTAEVFDRETSTWSTLPPLGSRRSDFALFVNEGKLYAIGGLDHNKALASSEVFDPMTVSWSDIPALSTCRHKHACVAWNGILVAAGGHDGDRALASAELLNLDAIKWQPLPPMSTPRFNLTMTVADGKIFAVGGMDSRGDVLASAEVFDPEVDEWFTLPSMTVPRCLPVVVVVSQE